MKLRIIYNGIEYKIQGQKRFLFKNYWDDMETYEVAFLARCSKGSYKTNSFHTLSEAEEACEDIISNSNKNKKLAAKIKNWEVVKEYN